MEPRHIKPCEECPWRLDSKQGYLGGWSSESYTDAVYEGVIPACHCADYGPEDHRTAYCAGAAATMANSCIVPKQIEPGQERAIEMVRLVGERTDVFLHPRDFYKYHTGAHYIMRILRLPKD